MKKPLVRWLAFPIVVATTCVEILWFAPKARSGYDMIDTPVIDLPFYCVPALVIVAVLFWISGRVRKALSLQIAVAVAALAWFWLLFDEDEFHDRVAAWSTFTPDELWAETLPRALVPVGVCSLVCAIGLYLVLKDRRADVADSHPGVSGS